MRKFSYLPIGKLLVSERESARVLIDQVFFLELLKF
jgi:hypothetical protein